jgi:hypothetical protein
LFETESEIYEAKIKHRGKKHRRPKHRRQKTAVENAAATKMPPLPKHRRRQKTAGEIANNTTVKNKSWRLWIKPSRSIF